MTIAAIIAERSANDIVTIASDMTLKTAVKLLAEQRIGAVPVLEGEKVVGILSERDIVYRIAADGSDCLGHPVAAVMTSPAITIDAAMSVDEALALMTKRRFRHFPVIEEGKLRAFISIGDLVKHKIEEVEHEAEAMRSYIQTA